MKNALKNPDLFRQAAYLNGKWMDVNVSDSGAKKITVTNPFDGTVVGYVPVISANEVNKLIDDSHRAYLKWRKTTAKERSALLKTWASLILQNVDDLAYIMTSEQGKTLVEAANEIRYAASFVEWFAEEGKRAYGDVIPTPAIDRRILAIKEPVGVSAAITPWNFPSSMVTRKTAPALAAGCSIILKPSELTPFSSIALAVLAEQAGIPAGVFNVVTGNAEEIGNVFCTNKIVRKISFTGSTEVGKKLYANSAGDVKRISLELGGNAPFIVFADANIDMAIKAVVASRFRNSGQTCVCANRILVEQSIYEDFLEKLVAAVETIKSGSGFDSSTSIGPLISDKAVSKANSLIDDAVTKGAKVLLGGTHSRLSYNPSVVAGVTCEMRIFKEEIFAPIASVVTFKDEEEAIKLANDTNYGLAAYFFTEDYRRIIRVSEALEYGMIGINEGLISTEVAPFGGFKESGIGREGAHQGLEEYLETKYLCLGGDLVGG